MPRIALGIEYTGNNYRGWQSQLDHPEVPCVQTEVEKALASVAAHPISTVCAGRTDAGVHAFGQVVHCDVTVERSMRSWVFGGNANLPRDIRITWAKQVPADFDARRTAIARRYIYVLYNNPTRPSIMGDYMSWYFLPLDAAKMHQAAQSWVGTHDFSSFRAAGCQSKSPVRDLLSIKVSRSGELIIFDIMANAFLYHMVRNMVGVLLQIGSGKKPITWAQEVLLSKNRTKAGVTAPPQGLYLSAVCYPEQLQIPQHTADLWFIKQG